MSKRYSIVDSDGNVSRNFVRSTPRAVKIEWLRRRGYSLHSSCSDTLVNDAFAIAANPLGASCKEIELIVVRKK